MKNNSPQPPSGRGEERTRNNEAARNMDLTDSPHDQERLRPDEVTIDLPDVKDIPGQEFIQVPPLGMMADTTISSDDEEGVGLFDDDEEDETDIVMGTEADISTDDKRMLEETDEDMPTTDDSQLKRASLDSTDFEGEELNEGSFGEERGGRDLDVPGATDRTATDALGEGDEENKPYSLGSEDNDNVTEGTP